MTAPEAGIQAEMPQFASAYLRPRQGSYAGITAAGWVLTLPKGRPGTPPEVR